MMENKFHQSMEVLLLLQCKILEQWHMLYYERYYTNFIFCWEKHFSFSQNSSISSHWAIQVLSSVQFLKGVLFVVVQFLQLYTLSTYFEIFCWHCHKNANVSRKVLTSEKMWEHNFFHLKILYINMPSFVTSTFQII